MGYNYNISRVFRKLIRELIESDDRNQGDRIMAELAEIVPNTINQSLSLVKNQEFYCTKPTGFDDTLNDDLDKQLFTFSTANEEHHTIIGFCSCQEYRDLILVKETSLTCPHELAVAIICYLCKICKKNNIQTNNSQNTYDFVQIKSIQEYINLINAAFNNNN